MVLVVWDLSRSAMIVSDISQGINDLISMTWSLLWAQWRHRCPGAAEALFHILHNIGSLSSNYQGSWFLEWLVKSGIKYCHRASGTWFVAVSWWNVTLLYASSCTIPGLVPCFCPLRHSWVQGSIEVISEIVMTGWFTDEPISTRPQG